MTRDEFVSSGLKSLAHNPDHPESILPQVPWSDIEYRIISTELTDDSFVIMDHDTFMTLLRPQRDFFCVPTPLRYT